MLIMYSQRSRVSQLDPGQRNTAESLISEGNAHFRRAQMTRMCFPIMCISSFFFMRSSFPLVVGCGI